MPIAILACLASGAIFGRAPPPPPPSAEFIPRAVDASHKLSAYRPECACDGKDNTYWLVPGGQRMEMMSRDKWIVLDLGENMAPVSAVSLRGVVDSFGPARVILEASDSPSGPWRCIRRCRALGTPLRWQRIELTETNEPALSSRFVRLYIRREGHATFRHRLHGVRFHPACKPGEPD